MDYTKKSDLEKIFPSAGLGYWDKSQVTLDDWNSYKWQLKNRITNLSQIEKYINLTEKEKEGILFSGTKLAFSITPYFLNLIDKGDVNCPIRIQVIPKKDEMITSPFEMIDPCGEDSHMPVPGLVHRYPDRVLFLVTDRCASYCRYCTRSRVVSGSGDQKLSVQFEEAFKYLEKHTEIRDVLLSGGDPLLLSDSKLEMILSRLRSIKHIEFLRIGSRIPTFLPQRITLKLCDILKKYHPLFMSIHVNHPRELTLEVKEALEKLANYGIPLGNQSVLLKGVNDNLDIMKTLVHKLIMSRVKPYYLYQLDLIKGSSHLQVPVQKGIDIIEGLRGHTTGYSIPQYVIDAPGGGGKVPINPDYVLSQNEQEVKIRNFENKEYKYIQST